jgi:hypothetical protein
MSAGGLENCSLKRDSYSFRPQGARDRTKLQTETPGVELPLVAAECDTTLHQAGVPASVAQAMIAHDSEAVHDNYVSVGSEAIRRAAATLPEI